MRNPRLLASLAVITSGLLTAISLAAFPARATASHLSPAPRAVLVAYRLPEVFVTARAPLTWTVRPGQTLSLIAASAYGNVALWPALWWVNRKHVRNPDLILTGQVLVLSSWHPQAGWLDTAARAARGVAAVTARGTGGDGDTDGDTTDRPAAQSAPAQSAPVTVQAPASYGSVLSYGQLEALWMSASGPAWAASHAASIAECESGGRVYAYNPSGATGLWQILGAVIRGNLYNPFINALNAVAKFSASGDTFAQWVCQ